LFDAPYQEFHMRAFFATGCLFVAFLLYQVGAANACTLCVGYPEKSAADVLIESSVVALAREDPDQPFSLTPVEFLKGDDVGAEIGLFLDSTTRRALACDPSRTVVIVRTNKDDSWRRLALASPEYEAILRRILLVAPQWQGAEGRQRRAEFFLPWFGHEDLAIFELAYLEIARAPYNVIKRISSIVPREQVEPILSRPHYLRWRWLAILMLAHGGDAKDKHFITQAFRSAERFRLSINLAAWAAASIEIEGASAVSFIQNRYFELPDRSDRELKEVFRALSLHGNEGRVELRDRIVAAYGKLLEIHPEMSAYVTADLLAWSRTEWTDKLAQIKARHTGLDDSAAKAIRRYLRRAETWEGETVAEPPDR
jgi:hypothetical protein